MTVLVFAEQSDTPVDAVVRELTARDVPVFRIDTSWFPRELVLEALLDDEGQWAGVLRTKHRTVDLGAIRSIWYRSPGAFSFIDGMTEVERAYACRGAPWPRRRTGQPSPTASPPRTWQTCPGRRHRDASYEWVNTPLEVEKGLRGYLAEMGLVYAAVDFAIDVNGRWIFLELEQLRTVFLA